MPLKSTGAALNTYLFVSFAKYDDNILTFKNIIFLYL